MFLKDVTIQNFRSLSNLSLSLSKPYAFIFGSNAAGKTSFLEALSLLSTGRSFLTTSQKELIAFDSDYFFLKINIIKDDFPVEMKYGTKGNGRVISVNGEPLKRLSDVLGKFSTILFTPVDFELVSGPPPKKRNYLDVQLSQSEPQYLFNLQAYCKILKNRNALLKKALFTRKEMDAWTNELVFYGSKIIEKRLEAILKINSYARKYLSGITEGKETLVLEYNTLETKQDLKQIENTFFSLLKKTEEKEKEYGYTITGPHRDDILILLNGKNAAKYASRGQIKSIVISLKFAEAENMKNLTGEWPVFLMDDIFPELDDFRKEKISLCFNKNMQIIMTSTIQKNQLPFLSNYDIEYYSMKKGNAEMEVI